MRKMLMFALIACMGATTASAQDYFKALAKSQGDQTESSWEEIPMEVIKMQLSTEERSPDQMSPQERAAYGLAQKITLAAVKMGGTDDRESIRKALKGYKEIEFPEQMKENIEKAREMGLYIEVYAKVKRGEVREAVLVFDVSDMEDMSDSECITMMDMMFDKGVSESDLVGYVGYMTPGM